MFDGRREWIKTLGTKDRREAKRLLPSFVVAFDKAMEAGTGSGAVERSNKPATVSSAPMPSVPTLGRKSALAGLKVPLIATFDSYAAEQGIKPATATEWRSILKSLVAFVGHDNAAALTVSDIDRWRDALLTEPGRNGKVRTPGTVKRKHLCALRATLAWALEKRYLQSNVAVAVKVRAPKAKKIRDRDFSPDEVLLILSATLNLSAECGHYERLARRWIPWLCSYTGARVNEISQLRGMDIRQVGEIWIINITPEAGTVKNNEARQVPVHPHLIDQGFTAIANAAGERPIFYDIDRVRTSGPSNRYYKKVGERLCAWLRSTVGLTDPHVQPNHGWRHTFKTRAMEAGIPERVADAIQGHAPRSVGQSYGTVSLTAKLRAIKAMPRFIVEEQVTISM